VRAPRIGKKHQGNRDILDDEPMIFGYRGKTERTRVINYGAKRLFLISAAPGIVDASRQGRFCSGIHDIDVGRRRGVCRVNGANKNRQARGESSGSARRTENTNHLNSPSLLGPRAAMAGGEGESAVAMFSARYRSRLTG
jgi:hypothetical protein